MNEPSTADISIKFPFVGIPSFLRAPICTDRDKMWGQRRLD